MRLVGYKALQQTTRWLSSRFRDHALILGYHRVADVEIDPHALCVSPQHFAEQLDVLQRITQPLTLRSLVDDLRAGCLPRRAIALTFDDGYVDVLEQACPLLERYEIPATVFVVSGCLGKRFPWDAAQDDAGRPLTPGELAELADSQWVDVGAHSISHPVLATLPLGEQRTEIEGSKEALQASLDVTVHGFSYPHGSTSKATCEIVQQVGYGYACASFNDTVHKTSDPFCLPRFWPGDWSGRIFERWLRRWL